MAWAGRSLGPPGTCSGAECSLRSASWPKAEPPCVRHRREELTSGTLTLTLTLTLTPTLGARSSRAARRVTSRPSCAHRRSGRAAPAWPSNPNPNPGPNPDPNPNPNPNPNPDQAPA
eukprot:scaffold18369_cov60-Phaeocystis_antarctica.AAC.2